MTRKYLTPKERKAMWDKQNRPRIWHKRCLCCNQFFRPRSNANKWCSAACRIIDEIRIDDNGCWLTTRQSDDWGYGVIKWAGKDRKAHRLSYETFVGAVPDGLLVCHQCDVPACCAPSHLFLGTHQDNMDDMVAKGRKPEPLRGENHGSTKLSAAVVLAIREDPRQQRDIAATYGIAQTTVSAIKRRVIWAHL